MTRITWDWREQFPVDELDAALRPHGLTAREVETASDQYEAEISLVPDTERHRENLHSGPANVSPGERNA